MTLEDLKQLRSLTDSAIDMIELGLMIPMSDEDIRRENVVTNGVRYDIRLGDFGVKKIVAEDPRQWIFTGNIPGTDLWYDENGWRRK